MSNHGQVLEGMVSAFEEKLRVSQRWVDSVVTVLQPAVVRPMEDLLAFYWEQLKPDLMESIKQLKASD